ncbi:3-oxoacyl-ACP synthase [Winogradskyella poriferorum]|uniref:3-oxoacyl-ACP synthase n=1 Tax=Winogradskyella poriferorum TaxID=307627 RepID=A0ABU7W2K1_9FLAO
MILKEQLYRKCNEALQERLMHVKKSILDLEQALQSETKSSAGDKHETGRAMIQIEREKAGQQLIGIQNNQELLQKIDCKAKHKNIALGSVVYTSQHNYFISISEGEIKLEDVSFYAISPHSPIAQLLLGKTEGDTISFRNNPFTVLKVI